MGMKPRRIRRDRVTLALSKGRILKPTVELFRRAGVDVGEVLEPSRKLIFHCDSGIDVMVVRGGDVPTYVANGAADLGVCGRDVVEESGLDLYTPVDLGIGPCRLVVAGPAAAAQKPAPEHLRIATKYPRLARRYVQDRGLPAHVLKLSGAIELAPLVGLSDRIVDLVETGSTLKQNGLVELETIMHITSLLVASPAGLKLLGQPVRDIIDRLAEIAR